MALKNLSRIPGFADGCSGAVGQVERAGARRRLAGRGN
jgi:hypothetical protein